MLSPTTLHAIGLAADPAALTLEMIGPEGASRSVVVAVEPGPVSSGWAPARMLLLPSPLRGEGNAWRTVSALEAPVPEYLREPAKRFRFLRLQGDLAYIQLRANIGRSGDTLRDFTRAVERDLDQRPPRTIILDNRHNGGGDLTRSADFTRFWAEAPDAVTLPDSGIRIGYATQMHDIGRGCHDRDVCHLAGRKKWNIAVGSLDPDLPVPTNFADFAAGSDPVLETVLAAIAASR